MHARSFSRPASHAIRRASPPSSPGRSGSTAPSRGRLVSAAAPPAERLRRAALLGHRPEEAPRALSAAEGALLQRAPTIYSRNDRQWTQAVDDTVDEHETRQQQVYDFLNNPGNLPVNKAIPALRASQEDLLENTLEFIRQRILVTVLSPTLSTRMYPPSAWPPLPLGDPAEYVPPAAEQGTLFFDDNQIYPMKGADRNAAAGLDAARPGLYVRDTGETAHADSGTNPPTLRVFMDRRFNTQALATIFIHEMQHVADKHEGVFAEKAVADVNREHGDVANTYRSEFRAYWVGDLPAGDLGSPDQPAANDRTVSYGWFPLSLVRTVRTGFANQRQERIFWYMVNAGIYPWLRTNYFFSEPFKRIVDGFTTIRGGNLVNSVRIDTLRVDLVDILRVLNLMHDATSKKEAKSHLAYLQKDGYGELIADAGYLDRLDRRFLRSAAAKPFWDYFNRAFAPDVPLLRRDFHQRKEKVRLKVRKLILGS